MSPKALNWTLTSAGVTGSTASGSAVGDEERFTEAAPKAPRRAAKRTVSAPRKAPMETATRMYPVEFWGDELFLHENMNENYGGGMMKTYEVL